ncbi:MAG: hypothetical protein AAF515_10005 [Pseudomonadota bacterium]
MTTVLDTIPTALQDAVDAALTAFNSQVGGEQIGGEQVGGEEPGETFTVTGIVNPPERVDAGTELELVLCGAGTCRRETFSFTGGDADPTWLGAPSDSAEVAELDPPPGARRDWLGGVLEKHRFVLLLFYRGFW